TALPFPSPSCRRGGAGQEPRSLARAVKGSLREDEVIDDLDSERPSGLVEGRAEAQVVGRGLRIARGMVVRERDARDAMEDRRRERFPWQHRAVAEAAAGDGNRAHHFQTQAEQDGPELLVRKV